MEPDLVSIIVLNWNNKQTITDCLESLLAQTYTKTEIILVDNGSSDGSLEEMKARYSTQIKIIDNGCNLGFAEGVNAGVRQAQGKFIAILNSDATADKQWLEHMVHAVKGSPKTGMAACKIFLSGQRPLLDNTGLVLSRDGQNRCRGRLEKDKGQYDQIRDVLAPSGCAALYLKSMLEEIGMFDTQFFAYGEDLDIGLRARMFGYSCVYVPAAIVDHKLSASTGAHSSLKAFYVERNRQWIVWKCFPFKHLLVSPFYTLIYYSYHIVGLLSRKGPSHQFSKNSSPLSLLGILIKCYASTLLSLPCLLQKRRALMTKADHKKDFSEWLTRYGISSKDAALDEIL